jgi:hypothetical protein
MQGLYFFYFYKTYFYMFSNVLNDLFVQQFSLLYHVNF